MADQPQTVILSTVLYKSAWVATDENTRLVTIMVVSHIDTIYVTHSLHKDYILLTQKTLLIFCVSKLGK